MSSIKFYNSDTQFEDDILIDEDDNVEFINVSIKNEKTKEETKEEKDKKEEGEINIIDEIKDDEIEYVDDVTDEFRDFIKTVKITRVVHSDYVDYTDDQFKNNILLLTKDNVESINTISNVNNLLSVYNNLKNKKTEKLSDKLFYPIISIKKKLFLIDTEKYTDSVLYNNSNSLVKSNIGEYLTKNKNISYSGDTYDVKENRLYELERPFDTLTDNETNAFKYIPEFNRDAITDCINENIYNFNFEDFKCVDILNNPRKLDKFRILSKKTYKVNDEDIRQLYSGDQVRIVGYINKIPNGNKHDNKDGNKDVDKKIKVFDLEQYYNDINDMKDGDDILIKLTVNNNNEHHKGKIISIKDNLINIKLDKKVLFIDNKKIDLFTYDTNSSSNYFTLYNSNEKRKYI